MRIFAPFCLIFYSCYAAKTVETIITLSVIITVSAVTFIIVTFINIHIFGLGTGLTYIVRTKCTVRFIQSILYKIIMSMESLAKQS